MSCGRFDRTTSCSYSHPLDIRRFVAFEGVVFGALGDFVQAVHAAIRDPWEPSEAWFIVAWHLAYPHVLRSLFLAYTAVYHLFKHRSMSGHSFDQEHFERSFFGFLQAPCRDLTVVYTVLWCWDMLRRELLANMAATSASAIVKGVDEAAYVIWGTVLMVRLAEWYLPHMPLLQQAEKDSPGRCGYPSFASVGGWHTRPRLSSRRRDGRRGRPPWFSARDDPRWNGRPQGVRTDRRGHRSGLGGRSGLLARLEEHG